MDGEFEINREQSPWPSIEISSEDYIFRQASVSNTIKRKRRVPSEACFILRPDEKDLSFNIERFIDAYKNYLLIGITHSAKGPLQVDTFRVFKLPVSLVKSLQAFKTIRYSPNFYGAPSPIGKPNNKSHVSLQCSNYDVGFRTEMAEYCQNNSDKSCFEFDLKEIKKDVEQLRLRGNETPFHNNWEFEY